MRFIDSQWNMRRANQRPVNTLIYGVLDSVWRVVTSSDQQATYVGLDQFLRRPISQWTSPQNDRPDAHRMERRDSNEEDRRYREDVPHPASHTRTPMLRCGDQIPCELRRTSVLDAWF